MNKNIKIILSIFFLLISYSKSFSQPQTEWVQRFNSPGNNNDYVTDMATDKSGNVYLTGYVQINDTDQNYLTIKYNTQGVEEWVRYYDGPDHREDRAGFIAIDDSGNVIVAGSSYSLIRSYDYLTIKYNSIGDSVWVRRHSNGLTMNAMTLDREDNIYITGIAFGSGSEDILTVRYDKDGNLEWEKYFNGKGNGYDVPHSITTDYNCNVYINGFSFGSSGSVTLKYDLTGNEKWVKYYFANWYYIGIDSLSNIYCGGETIGRGFDYCVLKYDSLGNIVWVRNYDNGNATNINDNSREMCVDKYGNTSITGVNTTNALDYDIATVKYNSDGDTLWTKRYTGVNLSNDESKGITSDSFESVYVGGSTNDASFTSKFLIIKYLRDGNEQFVLKYNNNPATSHSLKKIKTDISGNVFVTGVASGYENSQDIFTVKYATMVNMQNYFTILPKEFKLLQNYPNPFNPKSNINYELPFASNVSIKIFDRLGKLINTLVDKNQNAGKYEIQFDGSDLSSGIYFYSLSANGVLINTRKIILLK